MWLRTFSELLITFQALQITILANKINNANKIRHRYTHTHTHTNNYE